MLMAAPPLLLRSMPVLRLRLHLHHGLFAGGFRPLCAAAGEGAAASTESASPGEKVFPGDKATTVLLSTKEPPKYHRWDDRDYRKWKDKEDEILRDIEPIVSLAKEILHSDRYLDGQRLTAEDEKTVVEKLLKYHPHAEDKIGCGLHYLMLKVLHGCRCGRQNTNGTYVASMWLK